MIFQEALIKSLIVHQPKIAIEQKGHSLTYAELFRAANAVTGHLLQQSLPAETIIGIDVTDRAALISCIIGVLNSRCVFVPIDTTLPDERLRAMMDAMGLQYLITSDQSTLQKRGLHRGLHTFAYESMQQNASADSLSSLKYPSFDGEDSIYIYFTSGSTGLPKGIIGRNKSLLQFLQWELRAFELTTGTRVSQLISPYFDAFLRDIFAPLLCGGTICLPPQEEAFLAPASLASWLHEERISLVHCVPGVFRQLNKASLTPEHFPALQYILLSGERIVPAELQPWYDLFESRIQLVNLYGATESTMIRAWYKIQPGDAGSDRIPIGYPIDDTELLIATKDLRPCQPLVAGELYIVSDYISKGYLNLPDLNEEKFITLNAGTPQARIAFRTGDTARRLPDGRVDLLGRDDRQVKIRGIRIELDEIENRLVLSGVVGQALVAKLEENDQENLVAFVTRHQALAATTNVIEAATSYIRQYLPAYMIPAQVREVSAFPLLRNGKVNLQELLKQLDEQVIVPPATPTEKNVLAVWQEILGEKPISTTDGFIKAGGNSLSIMRLIGLLYKTFSVRVTLSELFNNLTIREQAALVDRSQQDILLRVLPAAAKPSYCLSAVQERMFYNYELNRRSTAYNMPIAWTISEAVDIDRVATTLRQLIDIHESLRTRFVIIDHQPQQVVEATVNFSIETWQTDDVGAALHEFIRPFELDKAPLMRAALIISANTRVFVIDTHHIICDGMSQVILREDFLSLYRNKKPATPTIQYKDYAEWEYLFRTSHEYLRNREFWLGTFEGTIPRLELPLAFAAENNDAEAGGSLAFSIPGSAIRKISAQFPTGEVTNFSLLFAAYFLFLYQLTGQDDVVVGTNTTGKLQEELERVTGMFTKTLPIRFRINTGEPFPLFAQQLHEYLLQAYSHQLYDLADIVGEIAGRASTPVSSLFDTMFVFQNFNVLPDAGNDFTEYSFEKTTAKYALTLMANEVADTFYFRFEYATGRLTRKDVEMLIAQFKQLIDRIGDAPAVTINHYIGGTESPAAVAGHDIVFNF